jgi:Putative beta-barrel porin 2
MEHITMKKLFVSLGLAAAGTASLYAAYAPDSSADNSKMWSLSGTLRGFYDDNYTTTTHKHGSAGFEASPSLSLNVPLQQTEIGLRYSYGVYYYQQRENNGQNPVDQTHQLDLWLDHAFTPRWETRLEDTLSVAQEPALTASGATSPYRIEGNNLANTFNASLRTDWTRQFGTLLTSQTSFYDYENSGGNAFRPSYAGLLNRVEEDAGLQLQWKFSPETVGLVGYEFDQVSFTGDEQIALGPTGYYYSDSRNNRSHKGYVGVQHNFLENWKGVANIGVQYTDYYNDPNSTSSLGPYADASMIYTYAAGSYAQVGVTESRNATDEVGIDSSGQITQDQESTVVYGSINHAITPKLTGSLIGHFQHSIYHQGGYNNKSADFYNLGLNLTYTFNRHISSEIGYNFDWYDTPVKGTTGGVVTGSYTRNRAYVGVTATY